MPGWRWRAGAAEPSDELAKRLSRFPAPELLGRLLVARGIDDPGAVRAFLQPSLADDFASPACIEGLDEAASRVAEAAARDGRGLLVVAERSGPGLVLGAAMTDGLGRLGLRASLSHDGPAGNGIDVVLPDGSRVSCGRARDQLPTTDEPCIRPRPDQAAGMADLAISGLVFYLMVALRARAKAGRAATVDLRPLLDLVGLGTVAEGAALRGVNRLLVRRGLERAERGERPGIGAMLEIAMARPVTAQRIAARIAPRLQAAIESAPEVGLELLTTVDPSRAGRLAAELEMIFARAGTARVEAEGRIDPIDVDAELGVCQLTPAIMEMLELLEPHGPGNPAAVLLARAVRLDGARLSGGFDRPHCLLRLRQDGRTVRAGAERSIEAAARIGETYDVVYRVRRGAGRPEIEVLALAAPESPDAPQVVESIDKTAVS